MAPARSAGQAFFPLDEQLGLLSAGGNPRGEEVLVRLAIWMPFEDARELLQEVLGIQVSKSTAHRLTLASGQAQLAVEESEQKRLQQEVPPAPAGADKQVMSGDGAMVHLVAGEWAEVKTLVLGEVARKKSGEVCTQHLSYFSRLSDASSFTQAALVETHRRGLEQATEVAAVQDGAEWLQGLVDYHRADAVRILDFPHAAEYINEIGEAVRAAGGRLPAGWLTGMLHQLKTEGPTRVLKHLAWLAAHYPSPLIQEKLAYLQRRKVQMQYPSYQQAGWPIGSGSVESANKLVVEARLKGAGMRWEWHNVNPMLVLRNAVCNGRWTQMWASSRAQRHGRRMQQRQPGTGCDAIEGFNRIHAILGTSEACIATHPSDMCVALAALDAIVQVEGQTGTRQIPFLDFHRLPDTTPEVETTLQPGELITAIDIPSLPFFTNSRYRKVRDRSSYAFALVSVAAALEIEAGTIHQVRLALGGVAHKPWRALAAEDLLRGAPATEDTFRRAAEEELKSAVGFTHNTFKIELAKRVIVDVFHELTHAQKEKE